MRTGKAESMDYLHCIVPPRPREKTRRIICRPKTETSFIIVFLHAMTSLLLLRGAIDETQHSPALLVLSVVLAVLVVAVGRSLFFGLRRFPGPHRFQKSFPPAKGGRGIVIHR